MAANLSDLHIDRERRLGRGRTGLWLLLALMAGAAGGGGAVFAFLDRVHGGGGEVVVSVAPALARGEGKAREGAKLFTAGGWLEAAFPYPRSASSLVQGRIEAIHVQENDQIKKGDLLAEIYRRDFEEKAARDRAELGVRRSELEVAQKRLAWLAAGSRRQDIAEARAKLRELASEVEVWRAVARRSEKLFEGGAVSKEQAEKDQAVFSAWEARLQGQTALLARIEEGVRTEEIAEQKAVVERARARVGEGEAALRIAETDLAYTFIRSPLDGVILRCFRDVGDWVNPSEAASARIFWIYNPQKIWVRIDVAPSDLGQVIAGAPVEIRVDTVKTPYAGLVLRTNPMASLAKNTVEVKVEITAPDAMLHPDMTARVTFLMTAQDTPTEKGNRAGPPLVPSSAVFTEAQSSFVYVFRDGTARLTEVTTGETQDGKVEILTGLRHLDLVVTSDPARLSDGQQVTRASDGQGEKK
jgi:RND family efflux transporter MFP subunit